MLAPAHGALMISTLGRTMVVRSCREVLAVLTRPALRGVRPSRVGGFVHIPTKTDPDSRYQDRHRRLRSERNHGQERALKGRPPKEVPGHARLDGARRCHRHGRAVSPSLCSVAAWRTRTDLDQHKSSYVIHTPPPGCGCEGCTKSRRSPKPCPPSVPLRKPGR